MLMIASRGRGWGVRLGTLTHAMRDHFKAIFTKAGVASRPELNARFLPELV
jgi:hypothetical protein